MYPSIVSLDIGDSFLLRFSLTDATDQARTFSNPVAIFTGINNRLSHCVSSIKPNEGIADDC